MASSSFFNLDIPRRRLPRLLCLLCCLMLGTPSRYAVPPNVPVAFLACCAAKCPARPLHTGVPLPSRYACCQMPGRLLCLLCCQMFSATYPACCACKVGMAVMGFYHVKSLRHHALWKGSVVWAHCGRQSMARPRRHRPSPTACRGRSRSLMTVTERRVKEARREPTQGSTPLAVVCHGEWIMARAFFCRSPWLSPTGSETEPCPTPGGGKPADGPLFLPWA